MEAFWEASEARGPLILEVERPDGSRPTLHALDRPSILVGHGPRSDLRLDDPEVSRRHAYLQVIAGRLFCVDLDTRSGTRVGVHSAGGWVSPGEAIAIGTHRIRAISGLCDPATLPPAGPDPLRSRSAERFPGLPPALILGEGATSRTVPVPRALTLIGQSSRCKIRLASAGSSRFHAALLRTARGTWIVDLASTRGISVNGVTRAAAPLGDGDEFAIGSLIVRVSDPGRTGSTALEPSQRAAGSQGGPPSAFDLRTLLEQVPAAHQPAEPFAQVLLIVAQMFGGMHREMLDLIREELDQIRALSSEMQALRASNPAERTAPARVPTLGLIPEEDPRPRDSGDIHRVVGERLAAFEREREGRWNKISRLLLKTAN